MYEKLKNINLCFAYNILSFVRRDLEFMKLIMDRVRNFSAATSFNISIPKSKIYLGGVDAETQELIQETTGFARGIMPFKYLGVPLASRKLSIADCQPLIERMLVQLNHWSTRLLSYAGRLQLLKSVIFSITSYWMQIFPLQKKIISHIYSMLRKFLWTGKDNPTRKAHVSWDHISDPISAGGSNLIYLKDWNKETIGKLL